MNNNRIGTCEQVFQPSKERSLMPTPHSNINIIEVDYRRDYIDARLLIAYILVVLVDELANSRYEIVDEARLVVSFDLLELVQEERVELFGRR